MKPKILILIDTGIIGGPGKGLFQLLRHAHNKVEYLLTNFSYPPPMSSQFNDFATTHGFHIHLLRSRFRCDPGPVLECIRLVKEGGFTLVQSHGYKTHIMAWLIAKATGIPWIAFAHGWTTENWKVRLYHKLDRLFLRWCDRAVAVSPKLFDTISSLRGTHCKTTLILNAVDQDEIPRGCVSPSVRERLSISASAKVLGCFGRLSSEKGQAFLIKAFRKFQEKHPDSALILTGDGPDRGSLETLIANLGLTTKVHLCGYQPGMRDFYEAIDLLVLPSLSEGLPNVALEAMALEKPVLATDVGAVAEIITHGENGWMVQAGDETLLANSLLEIFSSPSLVTRIGKVAKASLHPKFSAQGRANAIVALYKEVLGI